jgi:hypothetical protein
VLYSVLPNCLFRFAKRGIYLGVKMEKLEPSWGNSIPVWWSFFWRATLFGALAGGVLGFVGGVAVSLLGKPELAPTVGAAAGYIAAIPVSIWSVKLILSKKFKGYSVCLVKDAAE